MEHYIYKATNKANGKAYIGLTKGNMFDRMCRHNYDASYGSSFHFHKAIRKYDLADWEWEVLTECPNKKEAGIVERCLIKAFDTFENGYNMTEGGQAGPGMKDKKHSEKTKAKMKGRPSPNKGKKLGPLSDEQKRKQSATMKAHPKGFKKGNVPWTKGKKRAPFSEEHKKKIGDAVRAACARRKGLA